MKSSSGLCIRQALGLGATQPVTSQSSQTQDCLLLPTLSTKRDSQTTFHRQMRLEDLAAVRVSRFLVRLMVFVQYPMFQPLHQDPKVLPTIFFNQSLLLLHI